MKNSAIIISAVAGLCATAALAQPGGSISQNNMFFQIGAAPTSPLASAGPSTTLRGNDPVAPGVNNPNHNFEAWWWYRVAGETRESAFNSGQGTGETSSFSGNAGSMTQFYPGFRADMQWEVFSTGAGSGYMQTTLTITNTGTDTLNISLFNYADIDLNNTAGNDQASLLANNDIFITDSTGPYEATYSGVGSDGYAAQPFAALRSRLTNGLIDNLGNTGLPFGPGDFTGGFQWDVAIDPFFSRSVVATISLVLVPTPGTAALLIGGGLLASRRRRA